GYSGAKLSLIQDVIDEGLFAGPQGLNKNVLDMLNVKYISAQRSLPLSGFTEVYSENDHHVYENEDVLPKAWFVDRIVHAKSPREAFNQILPESNFNPRETATVESDRPLNRFENTDPESKVRVDTYQARRIVLSLDRNEPGFLVLSEIYYPKGWTATLNGEEIPIHKTNYLLRGFAIPAGEHTLELTFNPASHIWGSRISWAANSLQWFIGILLLFVSWKPQN
ncbi:MAG: YfhO family protein, partial [Balneolaceae bacterium]